MNTLFGPDLHHLLVLRRISHLCSALSSAASTFSLASWIPSLYRYSPTLGQEPTGNSHADSGPFSFPSAALYPNHRFLSSARPPCSAGIHLCVHLWNVFPRRKPEQTNMALTLCFPLYSKIRILCCLLSDV